MSKDLVIVESPAKAKTIENYLGKDFKVSSSYGHIRDLPKNNHAIDIKNGFEPTYEINKDKAEIVKNLQSLVKKSKTVYLASDDDREGESIAWHLKNALNLKKDATKRIVFREITKKAILNAIKNPRDIDMDLVYSQQARRILDRLVGFDLSPVLWSKIKGGLSAGRVQSVATRFIVEREREILKFKPTSNFKLKAIFNLEKELKLLAELNHSFSNAQVVNEFLTSCIKATFTIESIDKKPSKKSPSPPFTTSTLQQEASYKLNFSVSQTMLIAQKLYEAGKISYMRTDSVNLSDQAIENAKKVIADTYGQNYVKTRKYKTKSSVAQEAHEAIRPTNFSDKEVSSDAAEQKLYNLIWRRAIASQMEDAKIEKTVVGINISSSEHKLIAKGESISFKGFLEVYNSYTKDSKETMLPNLETKQKLFLDNMFARQKFTKPPSRYTEAGLVRKLEEEGIGRPSTYAPTISTIQKRGYVIKESQEGVERKYILLTLKEGKIKQSEEVEIVGKENQKMFPTDIGMVVNDFLVEHFPKITDFGFTAKIEEKLDEIAHKGHPWKDMISNFYKDFKIQLEKTEAVDRTEVKSSKILGKDPKTGKTVVARIGKYGPLVQLGENNEEEKPKYASMKKGQLIETITLEDALELFKLPRNIGNYEASEIIINIGKFGPYVKHINKFYSIPKGEYDPYTLSKDDAIHIIEAKRKADKEKIIKIFNEDNNIQILSGRWGPYIKYEKKNIKIPKDTDPTTLNYEQCLELIKNAPEKKRFKKNKK